MAEKSGKDSDLLKEIASLLLETARYQKKIFQQLERADSNVVSAVVHEFHNLAHERAKQFEQPNPDATPAGDTLFCSFCGKCQYKVKKLIAGTKVFICDECVVLCMDIVREEPAEDASED